VKGIFSYAHQVGPWHVWIESQSGAVTPHKLPTGWNCNGVIAKVDNEQIAEFVASLNVPVVNVSDDPEWKFEAPRVRTDDAESTRLAARHFLERGLKNVGFIGPNDIANANEYLRHFIRASTELGLDCQTFQFSRDDLGLISNVGDWIQGLTKPVGILAWGHGFARNVMESCLERQVSVPHDVAVLSGSYDELFSHACFPSLSGIQLPTESIGYQAAKLLHELMEGHAVPNETFFIPPRGVQSEVSTDTLAVKDPQLVQVVNFIRGHAFEPITMKDILEKVPIARRSLERRFLQSFGRSPIDEIRRLRIDRARKLLAETDLQMEEIAERCGYATYNYLTHVFKKMTGMTPRSYRKKFRD